MKHNGETVQLEAIVGNNEFIYADSTSIYNYADYRQFAQNTVYQSGIKAPRNNPRAVTVRVNKLEIEKGKLVRKYISEYVIDVPLERMNESDFENEMGKLLDGLPPEFHPFIRTVSWDDGHSAGFEEVVSIATRLTEELKPCIYNYRKKLFC